MPTHSNLVLSFSIFRFPRMGTWRWAPWSSARGWRITVGRFRVVPKTRCSQTLSKLTRKFWKYFVSTVFSCQNKFFAVNLRDKIVHKVNSTKVTFFSFFNILFYELLYTLPLKKTSNVHHIYKRFRNSIKVSSNLK